jgi:hypothetical protein
MAKFIKHPPLILNATFKSHEVQVPVPNFADSHTPEFITRRREVAGVFPSGFFPRGGDRGKPAASDRGSSARAVFVGVDGGIDRLLSAGPQAVLKIALWCDSIFDLRW